MRHTTLVVGMKLWFLSFARESEYSIQVHKQYFGMCQLGAEIETGCT